MVTVLSSRPFTTPAEKTVKVGLLFTAVRFTVVVVTVLLAAAGMPTSVTWRLMLRLVLVAVGLALVVL